MIIGGVTMVQAEAIMVREKMMEDTGTVPIAGTIQPLIDHLPGPAMHQTIPLKIG